MRNIALTGIGSGIGLELFKHFQAKGHLVIGISRLKSGEIRMEKVSETGYIIYFDWNDYEGLSSILDQWVGEHGQLDILINNAGLLIKSDLNDLKYNDFKAQFEVNVWNVYNMSLLMCSNEFLTSNAHVVNIGSMGGVQTASKFPGLFAYSASKASLITLTQFMQLEWGGKGRSFNCLALGAVDTEMLQKAFPGYKSEVTPENMAEFIASFSMSSGGIVGGQVIEVRKSDPNS